MHAEPNITHEIAQLPQRSDFAHKGDVGRIAVIGGSAGEVMMVGAPALTANAALSAGAGLVQVFVPEPIRSAAAVLASCATIRSLPHDVDGLNKAARDFQADVIALGPGLGDSLTPQTIVEFLETCESPIVLDADGLNLLARATNNSTPFSGPVIMTPHPGEAARLLAARGVNLAINQETDSRMKAACTLAEAYGATVVLKGRRTVVTNGKRLYVNETGNAGMATGGTGDVLTGVIAALIGQHMEPLEAAILGTNLHGLAGDFAAEEMGRWSMTALDLLNHLPEAFCEHQMTHGE